MRALLLAHPIAVAGCAHASVVIAAAVQILDDHQGQTARELFTLTTYLLWLSGLFFVVMVALMRAKVLRDLYAVAYRHGRHDANTSLLRQGIWLAHAAKKDAEDTLGDV